MFSNSVASLFTYARGALGFASDVEQEEQVASTDNVFVDVEPLPESISDGISTDEEDNSSSSSNNKKDKTGEDAVKDALELVEASKAKIGSSQRSDDSSNKSESDLDTKIAVVEGGREIMEQLQDEMKQSDNAYASLRRVKQRKTITEKRIDQKPVVDIEALVKAVEKGGDVSPTLFASLNDEDKLRLEQCLLKRQKEREQARLKLEQELKRVADEDARMKEYMSALSAATPAANDAPAPSSTEAPSSNALKQASSSSSTARTAASSDTDETSSDDEPPPFDEAHASPAGFTRVNSRASTSVTDAFTPKPTRRTRRRTVGEDDNNAAANAVAAANESASRAAKALVSPRSADAKLKVKSSEPSDSGAKVVSPRPRPRVGNWLPPALLAAASAPHVAQSTRELNGDDDNDADRRLSDPVPNSTMPKRPKAGSAGATAATRPSGVSKASLRAKAPAKCTECLQRAPRARIERKGEEYWLCAACLVEKQSVYAKHGTLRRKSALSALKGQIMADSAVDLSRPASKATLRAVKKMCGSCLRNKAKHKAVMASGRTVILCDQCLAVSQDRRRQLDACFADVSGK